MTFPPTMDNGFCSIRELHAALSRLALPHFQRGQVWGDSAVSRLLESLMLDTPCGSIILWKPHGLAEGLEPFGVRVDLWATQSPEYLVVDGQQRLTTLSRVFAPGSRWAINLAAEPKLHPDSIKPSERQRRRELFVEWPAEPTAEANDRARKLHDARVRDLVLISGLREEKWPYPDRAPPPYWSKMVKGIGEILSRRIQVVVKRDADLGEIVGLYNRINSSGVVVREEERAFATMFGFNEGTGEWLRDSFAAVHGGAGNDRNDALERQRENRFGFRLFIRTFGQAAALHMGKDRVDLNRLDEWLWDPLWMANEAGRMHAYTEAARVLERTASILRDRLMCDDFRFVPSAEAMRPVFALMLRFPDLDEAIIARCLMSLQLPSSGVVDPLAGRDRLAAVRRANSLVEALACFPTLREESQLLDALRQAQSMQDRWVSILYWLQRCMGAQDYGGRGASGEDYSAFSTEIWVPDAAHKEHLVPFSLLRPAFDLEGRGGHSRTHVANAIGNLTFVSETYNYAHGADPIQLWEIDRSLLGPHQLAGEDTLEAYKDAVEHLGAGRTRDGVHKYRVFVDQRTRHIARDLHAWLAPLMDVQPGSPKSRPARQRIRPSAADEVRDKRWPGDFETVFLDLIGQAGSDGKFWVLYREGTGNERTRVAHRVRLKKDGTQLCVGKRTAYSDVITTTLATCLTPDLTVQEDDSQRWYELDPHRTGSARLLMELKATGPWREMP